MVNGTNGKWIHLALAIILAGACVTHFFGQQGEVHLRYDKAETVSVPNLLMSEQRAVTLFLWDFQVVYDDQNNPADYITDLRLLDRSKKNKPEAGLPVDSGVVRMNKPLKYNGWRFCQADYDSDSMGVVLAYNYDPWGIGITYAGYGLLLAAMIAFFFQKHTRFRVMLHQLTANSRVAGRVGVGVFALIVIALSIVMTKVVTPKPPLQPVLQTPLLGIHVSVIMLAYTLFAVIAICGIVGLCSKKHSMFVYRLSSVLLYPAVFSLAAGIFIGAVWANLSWGRYWGWDPKETWALITMIVYAALIHYPRLARQLNMKSEKLKITYHLFSVVAFFFVLFTYFGVSYLLGGLHSYA